MASQTSATRAKTIKVRSAAKASARVKVPKKSTTAATTKSTSKVTRGESAEEVVVPAPKTRRKPKVETRTRVYWGVFNPDLKRVATFEFDQKEQAEKRADKLSKSSGGPHFIQKIKAIVQV